MTLFTFKVTKIGFVVCVYYTKSNPFFYGTGGQRFVTEGLSFTFLGLDLFLDVEEVLGARSGIVDYEALPHQRQVVTLIEGKRFGENIRLKEKVKEPQNKVKRPTNVIRPNSLIFPFSSFYVPLKEVYSPTHHGPVDPDFRTWIPPLTIPTLLTLESE